MLVVSCLIAIGLPIYISLAIHPGYESLVVRQVKEAATRLTAYLVSDIIQDAASLNAASFSDAKRRRMGDIQRAFGLHKLNVFSADGTVVYSTDPGAIGTAVLEATLVRSLTTGQSWVKLKRNGRPGADQRLAPAALVECYIPIMVAGTFGGVVEIHVDISERLDDAESLYAETMQGAWWVAAAFVVFSLVSLGISARQLHDQRRTARTLAENEERFRSMSASVHDALLAIDDVGAITFWNDAAQTMFGYAGDQVLGKALHPLLAPERFAAAYRHAFQRFKETGEGDAVGRTLELTARRHDGTEFPIELSLSSYCVDGRWHAVGTVRDITQRKQAENEKEKLITDLQQALDEVDTLKGIVPICQYCKSIRDDRGYWNQIESYISRRSGADLSHGICPDCARKHYPDLDLYGE